MIDWLNEAKKYQNDLFRDLEMILTIPSVRDTEHATKEFPLGPGPAEALTTMLDLAERDGFTTKNVENVAGRIEYGDGPETLGVFGHLDVVPAGDGWQTDPFKPVIKDGKLYARGSADDKGPALAAYYALKILKDLNLPVNKKIHYILGTDEESEWYGINRYLAVEPTPDFGFSPDAEFPIINGEKGIASFKVTFKAGPAITGALQLRSFDSGIRENMVPQNAQAVLVGHDLDDLSAQFTDFAAENELIGDAQLEDRGLILSLTGKGAHALEPDAGVNAGTYLATFLNQLPLDEAGQQYVRAIAQVMQLDSRGHKLGVAYQDQLMGDLTASPDIFNYQAGENNSVIINIRYPQGTTAETINQQINTTMAKFGDNIASEIFGHAQTPHYVPANDPLVQTLLAVYERQTGLKGQEQIIGGGTYGRLLKRGVAFGAQFPGQPNVMHQANEYMPVADILKATAIYAEALYELTK
ncbi:dipeptidase PepV [Lapidilactobacillus wuchangensis]|uniref:dipeptidase PepV n=1 Tax=Lapidilactobacillus wuchangensis TaxID=2486001 RepID=UPI000F788566|nr:dipeptidase PepV [Lapidilactobacillus wuchangensis]